MVPSATTGKAGRRSTRPVEGERAVTTDWLPVELSAIRNARSWLLDPCRRLYRSAAIGGNDDAYEYTAAAALGELVRVFARQLVPVSAEPSPPIAAELGDVPTWVSKGDTGMWPVVTLGLLEEFE